MFTNKFNECIFDDIDIFRMLYSQEVPSKKYIVKKSNDILSLELELGFEFQNPTDNQTNIKEFDLANQNNWYMPDEYKNMDIEGFLVNICPKQHYQRLIDELQEFRSRDMINLLRWLKYFVDTCRSNNIFWGVGRGSSVASYTLFLIGVHKIDSIKYNLDWREFLR